MIRRRHVFYIAGYDPQGVPGYYRLFKRELDRFQSVWPLKATLSEPVIDSDGLAARWEVATSGPNWQVATTYEFLRWDDIIKRDMARRMPVRIALLARVLLENIFNGTIVRVFRAGWRFGLFYLFPYLFVAGLILLPLAFAGVAARIAMIVFGLPMLAGLMIAAAVAVATYFPIRRYGDRWSIIAMADAWIWFRDWGRGLRPDYEDRIDAFARRVIAEMRRSDADEILLIGHSGGGTTAIPVVARALALDADFTKSRPPFTVLALGTSLPLAASHRPADGVRDAIARVAREPNLRWVECQARQDACNFQDLDPVADLGIAVCGERKNPHLWRILFKHLLSQQTYQRVRLNIFRMHFQFIMANDRRAAYDYFMFVCGPVPLSDWVNSGDEVLSRFAGDGAYAANLNHGVSSTDAPKARPGVNRVPSISQSSRTDLRHRLKMV